MKKTSTHSRQVIVAIYQQCQVLDVSGPVEVFEKANLALGRNYYSIKLVAARTGKIETSGPVCLYVDFDFDSIKDDELVSLDTLVVVGGSGVYDAIQDAGLLAFIERAAKHACRLVSVCSGAFLLAEAGLLENRRATTHWDSANDLAEHYRSIDVDADAIYLRDGNVWSSAGVTAGIDLTLALVECDLGNQIALAVARQLVVYMMRPGGQSQFSTQLKLQRTTDNQMRKLVEWIDSNPTAELSITVLASRCSMSERNFTRRFTQSTGISPARFVEQSRFEYARRKLEGSDLPLQKVADNSGFKSTEVLRRLFQRKLGISPSEYRMRFRTSIRSTANVVHQ